MIDLKDIENRLDEALKKETPESWMNFLIKERLEEFIGNGKLFNSNISISGTIDDNKSIPVDYELNNNSSTDPEYKKGIASITSKAA